MLQIFKKDKKFYYLYINLLAQRSAFSSLTIEYKNADLASTEFAYLMLDYESAYKYIFEHQKPGQKLDTSTMTYLNKIINQSDDNIPDGFRRVMVLTGQNYETVQPYQIPYALMSALNNYYNIWDLLDPYEREARLFLELVRIQPFEDGNKRTATIILNYNLTSHQLGPVIIDNTHKDEYLRCIEENDAEALARVFERLSERELNFMVNFHNKIAKLSEIERENILAINSAAIADRMFEKLEKKGKSL